MKIKESINISNKKKNALPSSKLLKPKKFKTSLKKSIDGKNLTMSKGKVKLIESNKGDHYLGIKSQVESRSDQKTKNLNNNPPSSSEEIKFMKKQSKIKQIPRLFDFDLKDEHNGDVKSSKTLEPKRKTPKKSVDRTQFFVTGKKDKFVESVAKISDNFSLKVRKTAAIVKNEYEDEVTNECNVGHRRLKKSSQNINLSHSKVDESFGRDMIEGQGYDMCKLKTNKVSPIVKGLLKLIEESRSIKSEILDVGEPIFLQVECIKIPICPTKQLRFKLPNPLVDETCDVLLITSDLKGHKIYPDKAIEFYEELFVKTGINFIHKVMPYRMIKKEYSQYEMKRKLVDQFDVILADSRIIKSLPSVLGKFALYKRKMPIPVNLMIGEQKLKKHLRDAVSKSQMTVKSNGHCSVVQVGNSKMDPKEIAANIVEIGKSLEKLYPGGWRNIRSLVVKTAKSTSLPVYLSLLSPNEVKIPVEVRRKPQPVEGELSTMPGHNVIVTHDGNVILKKVEEEIKIDDTRDNEILEEAQKYLESSKTVRYDESSDEDNEASDSDDEGEAITEAMEKKLMNKYEKNAKKRKNNEGKEDGKEEDEEEEEESEQESEIAPVTGKKRKLQKTKKQSGPPAKKASGLIQSKGKGKAEKSTNDSKNAVSPGIKKPRWRGTRGGKKNKLSKDQRKALIKRKKAGKK